MNPLLLACNDNHVSTINYLLTNVYMDDSGSNPNGPQVYVTYIFPRLKSLYFFCVRLVSHVQLYTNHLKRTYKSHENNVYSKF